MVKTKGVAVTGAQLRAARALIGMRAEDLAQESKVSLRTIRRAEQEEGPVKITGANISAITRSFESRGVQFFREATGAGVMRLFAKPVKAAQ